MQYISVKDAEILLDKLDEIQESSLIDVAHVLRGIKGQDILPHYINMLKTSLNEAGILNNVIPTQPIKIGLSDINVRDLSKIIDAYNRAI